jgi:starch synthase
MSLHGFLDAIRRGLDTFKSRSRLAAMRRAAMSRPQGWSQSARKYKDVYNRAHQAVV